MADYQHATIYLIRMKIGTRGLSRLRITNLHLKFFNSKWLIQYGGSIYKNLLYSGKNWYSGFFEVADYKSSLNILKLEIVDPIWRIKMSTFA